MAFSSQLSCTIQAVYAAREELLAKYPQRKFIVVDTLSISGPMTMLLLKAHELYREGKSMEEVAQWLEENKLRAQAFFTVDDLKYLKRGGRLSATSAVLGTMLDLKPIIVESKEGKLVPVDKVRGRKKAMSYLVDKSARTSPIRRTRRLSSSMLTRRRMPRSWTRCSRQRCPACAPVSSAWAR